MEREPFMETPLAKGIVIGTGLTLGFLLLGLIRHWVKPPAPYTPPSAPASGAVGDAPAPSAAAMPVWPWVFGAATLGAVAWWSLSRPPAPAPEPVVAQLRPSSIRSGAALRRRATRALRHHRGEA